jgi:hypothetical protein
VSRGGSLARRPRAAARDPRVFEEHEADPFETLRAILAEMTLAACGVPDPDDS